MGDFREDLYPESERNLLKVDSRYIILSPARGRNEEYGLTTVIGNIPSRFLEQGRQNVAIDWIIRSMHQITGFNLVGPNHHGTRLDRETFCVEATYVLVHSTTRAERTWTGSWRNSLGQLTPFVDLAHRGQVVTAVGEFAAPGAVETKLAETFGDLDSEWTFDGLVSLVLNFSLRGTFSPQFRRGASLIHP